jgi:hypothetical protein
VKPGDLVYIIDHGAAARLPPRIGLIVGEMPMWSTQRFPVLYDGEIIYPARFELRLVNDDGEDYDGTRENK